MFRAMFLSMLLLFGAAGPDVKVYKGTSLYNSDIRYTMDGHLTLPEFVAVWHAVTYVY